jgi:hypothetical protein
MMISLFRQFIRDRKAAVLPMAALLFPVILGMTGLGVDASNWMMTRRNLQNAADAAAISAAWEIANGYDDTYEAVALSEAEKNGYDSSKAGSTLEVDYTVTEDGTENITANLSMRGKLWFSALLFNKDVSLANAAATAIIEPTGNFCILSLDEESDGAISAMGDSTIDANGCGLAVNSNSDTALDFTGSVVVHVGDVSIVGGHEVPDKIDFEYDSMRTNANPIPDPYTDLEVPPHSCPSYSETKVKTDQTITNASGIKTFCGGLSISSGAVVHFEPGIYIIDGGDFSINSGTVTGEGVTFILTNSGGGSWGNFDITGGDISFSAPGEGEDMAGIVFYQDRNAPASVHRNKFVGNGNISLDGVVYTPSRGLDFGGNSGATSETCTKLIGKTIKFHGNPAIGNNCAGNPDIMNIGIPNIKLIQ